MRILLLSMAVLAAGLASGCQTPQAQRVRVLTYNIHHGEGTDAVLDLERIARVITNTQPDLVALQEVDNRTERTGRVNQAAELGRLTGMHAVFGKAMDYQGGGYGLAILSRWPIAQTQRHPLPSTEGHEPRALLLVRVRADPMDKEGFWFGSTHLDHTREDLNRMNHARRIIEVVAGMGQAPVILAGDFNAVPETPVMEMLFEHFSDGSAMDPRPTIPVVNPMRRIDYVLFRPHNKWMAKETRVLPEEVASDHRPLLVVLEYSR